MDKIIDMLYKFKSIIYTNTTDALIIDNKILDNDSLHAEESSKSPLINCDYKITVTLAGNEKVGKTGIFEKFMYNKWREKYNSTIGVDFDKKNISVNNKIINFRIWDTCGHKSFETISRLYYKQNVNAIIIIFDISDKDSLIYIDEILQYIRIHNVDNPPVYLVGNKLDLTSDPEYINKIIDNDDVINYCDKNKLKYYCVSAKLGFNIDYLFNEISKDLLQSLNQNS
jgi:Ras-related protein Rab-2A